MARPKLRVIPGGRAVLPAVVNDPAARREFERLTERLVEISIEIIDLVDGDPDVEANGDEFQPEDDSEPEIGI